MRPIFKLPAVQRTHPRERHGPAHKLIRPVVDVEIAVRRPQGLYAAPTALPMCGPSPPTTGRHGPCAIPRAVCRWGEGESVERQ